MDERKVEYLKAWHAGDIGAMATIIRRGLPEAILGEGVVSTYDFAAMRAREDGEFVLVDALLSRDDIAERACAELFDYGMSSIRLLRYLEEQGVDLAGLIRKYPRDVMCELLRQYVSIITYLGGDRCEELCKIIEFFKERGVNSLKAYEWLANDQDKEGPMTYLGDDCFNRVAKLLKPKGGRQWRIRG